MGSDVATKAERLLKTLDTVAASIKPLVEARAQGGKWHFTPSAGWHLVDESGGVLWQQEEKK